MNEYKGLYEMPQSFINKLWPNLNSTNYELKSNSTDNYNCVAWANHINYEPVDLSLDNNGEPLVYPDLSCLTYIEYFENQGFELCESSEWEEGFEKIALYERDDETFEHVARQVSTNIWTSKLGEWEDIEHTTLESLQSSHFYGIPAWYMRRRNK